MDSGYSHPGYRCADVVHFHNWSSLFSFLFDLEFNASIFEDFLPELDVLFVRGVTNRQVVGYTHIGQVCVVKLRPDHSHRVVRSRVSVNEKLYFYFRGILVEKRQKLCYGIV